VSTYPLIEKSPLGVSASAAGEVVVMESVWACAWVKTKTAARVRVWRRVFFIMKILRVKILKAKRENHQCLAGVAKLKVVFHI
jgi:hypothetical protein